MRPIARFRPIRALGLPELACFSLIIAACGPGADAGNPGAGASAAEDVSAETSFPGAQLAPPPLTPPPYDLAVWNARIVNGTGEPARDGGVLVDDGRVVYVGPLNPDTLQVVERVDAAGRVLAPGFIDPHAHGEPEGGARFANALAQGVTTILLGLDGTSPRAGELAGLLARIEASPPWVNVGYLIGHGTLRGEAGLGGPANAAGRERLAALVETAMAAGAFGLSTGLEYDSGRPADLEELAAAAGPVAAHDGIVMSHMRSEDADQVEASIEELLEQGRRSGARVHVSHIKVVLGSDRALLDRIFARMERARSEGQEVSADVYPYTASYTGLSILFPDFARGGADYGAVVASRRTELAEYLRNRINARNGPEATLFASGPYAGRTLAEVAAATGRPFEEILIDLGPSGANAAYFVMDDAWMREFLLDEHTVISSDGSPSMQHPRGYGSFAGVLRRFVVEEGALSIEEAVAKMSGRTAAVLGLSDPERQEVPRGLLQPGVAADLALFDPARLEAPADFEDPHQLARGMDFVWVNGVPAWDGAAGGAVPGGSAAGRALRH
jgi:N-acyl-D-aspartate/D-glutamate deacylase